MYYKYQTWHPLKRPPGGTNSRNHAYLFSFSRIHALNRKFSKILTSQGSRMEKKREIGIFMQSAQTRLKMDNFTLSRTFIVIFTNSRLNFEFFTNSRIEVISCIHARLNSYPFSVLLVTPTIHERMNAQPTSSTNFNKFIFENLRWFLTLNKRSFKLIPL